MTINSITDVPGIIVGHAQDLTAMTGCTVVLCEGHVTGGVDQRGGAPGTRETDALRPMHLVDTVNAVVLTGGSAFGLDCVTGVVRYLEERGLGYNTGVARVPIVPAAVLFDLAIGSASIRPDATMGYLACQNASSAPPEEGNVGAGTGATVGKIFGMQQSMKSGIGTACVEIGGGVMVGAIVAVNAFGDVMDDHRQEIIAGARSLQRGPVRLGGPGVFADTLSVMQTIVGRSIFKFASRQNTTIGVVATNARLSKEEANKVAQMAHNGLALRIRPTHTMFDGDTIFALATNQKKSDINIVGAFACEVVSEAIGRAVLAAKGVEGYPSTLEI